MTVVKGILTREQSSAMSVKYLIRVVEQASRILLDNAAAPTEPEKKAKFEFTQNKLLDFMRICFHTCLDLIIN